MRTLAYCTEVAADAVRDALGVEPLTSPPLTAETFPAHRLNGLDLLYFRLHGKEGERGVWRGEGKDGARPKALTRNCLWYIGLWGCTVLVANCYGADDPLVDALYAVGAEAVITGGGANYAMGDDVAGTDLLARWLKYGLQLGLSPQWALRLAKMRLWLTKGRRETGLLGQIVQPNADALAFQIEDRPGGRA